MPDPEELSDPEDVEQIEPSPVQKVNPDLAAAVASVEGTTALTVVVSLAHEEPGLQVELNRAMAEGVITNHDEFALVHDQLIAERQLRLVEAMTPLTDAIADEHGSVLVVGRNSPYIVASLPADAIGVVAARDDVRQVDVANRSGSPAATQMAWRTNTVRRSASTWRATGPARGQRR